MTRRHAALALSAITVFFLAGCATPPRAPDKLALTPVTFTDLPGWSGDRVVQAIPALLRSCAVVAKRPADVAISASIPEAGRARDWQSVCADAARLSAGDEAAARAFFMQRFRPYRAANNGDPKGLFTGYYEIELNGSRTKSARYPVPIYGLPKDLVTADLSEFDSSLSGKTIIGRVAGGKFHPYPDRATIEAEGLGANAPVIAWVDDAVDAFFLHIQGSGLIKMANGEPMRVGYAAKNGQPYRAIGRVLVDRNALAKEDVSMQSIRAWLAANPRDAQAVMATNPSYVFFRELPKPQGGVVRDGPDGAQGVTLTAGRSLAVDRRFVPLGIPIWVAAQSPDSPDVRTQRLVVAQDTGGAITGPVRGDVFWGTGHDAAERAGKMREFGNYYFLLPRLDASVAEAGK
jgi:membrane-bound lytic murein transglycosylase A